MARRKAAHSVDRQGKRQGREKEWKRRKKEKDIQHLNRNKRNVSQKLNEETCRAPSSH